MPVQIIVTRLLQQTLYFGRVLCQIVFVPPLKQHHATCHQQPKKRHCALHANAAFGDKAVCHAQPQDGGLLIEVLHRNGAPCTHQAMPTVL